MLSQLGRVPGFISVFALTIVCSACGGSIASKMADSFPTKAELSELTTSKKAPEVQFGPLIRPVETWQLTGPFPEQIGRSTHEPVLPWERSFAQGIKGDGELTEEMTCAARETGMFYVKQGAYPNDSLESFIAARCGSVSNQVQYWRWELNETVSQESLNELYARFDADWADNAYWNSTNHVDYGLWFGEHEQRRVLVIARSKRAAELEPMSRRMGEDGTVVIRGKLLRRADRVRAMINRGEFEYEPCDVVESVKLPAFELRCKGNPGDSYAYFSIQSGIEGQSFDSSVTGQMVWGSLDPAFEYRASTVRTMLAQLPEQGAVTEETLDAQLLAAVNHVRAYLQYPALELDGKQSLAVRKAVPYLFGREDGLSEEEHDARQSKIIQGLRAGWDVSKPISNGSFVTDFSGSTSLVDVVSSLLERPSGRAALLARDPSLLAVGGLVNDGRVAVAAFVYERAIPLNYDVLAGRVSKELNRQRKDAGLKKFKRLSSFNSVAEELSKDLAEGDRSIEEVGDKLATKVSSGMNSGVRYYMLLPHSLEHIHFDDELLRATKLRGALAVAMYKPEGSPWWVYGVVIVVPSK